MRLSFFDVLLVNTYCVDPEWSELCILCVLALFEEGVEVLSNEKLGVVEEDSMGWVSGAPAIGKSDEAWDIFVEQNR